MNSKTLEQRVATLEAKVPIVVSALERLIDVCRFTAHESGNMEYFYNILEDLRTELADIV